MAGIVKRYKLVLGWRGTNYFGWQKNKGDEDDKSIHTRLKRITTAFHKDGSPAPIVGTSRTDSGVHAFGAVAHIDFTDLKITEERLFRALNFYLQKNSEDIWVQSVQEVPRYWSCREGSRKQYIYRIAWNSHWGVSALDADTVWCLRGPLDYSKMEEACSIFLGTHDFTGFSTKHCENPVKVKTIYRFEINKRESVWKHLCDQEDMHYADFTVKGNGFLYRQVRKMVAAVVAVGMGKLPVERVKKEVLINKNNNVVHMVAPAHGLYLHKVLYPDDPDYDYSSINIKN